MTAIVALRVFAELIVIGQCALIATILFGIRSLFIWPPLRALVTAFAIVYVLGGVTRILNLAVMFYPESQVWLAITAVLVAVMTVNVQYRLWAVLFPRGRTSGGVIASLRRRIAVVLPDTLTR
jgi:Na+/melibiose symporter-like transporter